MHTSVAQVRDLAPYRHKRSDYWTPERVELLKTLRAEGHSASQIAKRLGGGVTRNAVIGKVSRLGLKRDAASFPTRRPPFLWTQDLDKRLRRAVKDGRTDAEIALELGAPLASVSHRRRVLGLDKRGVYRRPTLVFSRPESAAATHGEVRPPEPPDPADAPGKRTLLTLAFGECKWPMAQVQGEWTFCGEQQAGEGPYCKAHAERAYKPPKPGKAKPTANELMRALRRWI
ncbi:MAG: GcrA family cell cycle regulator [Trueperaceae bacterium]